MKRTTKLLVIIATAVSTVAFAGAGWTYWMTVGTGTGSAMVGTVASPINVQGTSTAGTGTVSVTWTGVPAPNGVSANLGYWVQRSKDGGAYTDACASSHAAPLTPSTVATCNDTGLADGSYTYKVTAVFRSWTAASSPSSAVAVTNAGPLDHFLVTVPDTATAGTAFGVTVTAQDVSNRTVTTFAGSVRFTSTDGQAASGSGLPADYTFTTGTGNDNGVHVFTNGVTLKTAGSKTVSVSGGGKSGTSAEISVRPAGLASFTVTNPGTQTAGTAFNVAVTALDAYGNAASGWTSTTGCVTFSGSANSPNATAPIYPVPTGSCSAGQSGLSFNASGQATASVTLFKASAYTVLTVKDAATQTTTGGTASFAVNSKGVVLSYNQVSPLAIAKNTSTAFTINVPDDQYGNSFTSSAGLVVNLSLTNTGNWGFGAVGTGAKTLTITSGPVDNTFTVAESGANKTTTITAMTAAGYTAPASFVVNAGN